MGAPRDLKRKDRGSGARKWGRGAGVSLALKPRSAEHIGQMAVATLIEKLEGREPASIRVVPMGGAVRASTQAIGVADRAVAESVKAISLAIGEPDTHHFSRFVKRHTGLSPSEYRQRHHRPV